MFVCAYFINIYDIILVGDDIVISLYFINIYDIILIGDDIVILLS